MRTELYVLAIDLTQSLAWVGRAGQFPLERKVHIGYGVYKTCIQMSTETVSSAGPC